MVRFIIILRSPQRWRRIVVLLISIGFFMAIPFTINASNNKKIDKLSRKCQAGNEKSCIKLAKIAKSGKKWTDREAAVEKLTDQVLLTEIAKNDENDRVRKTAVEKLTGKGLLAEIAKTDKASNVRKAAVKKLADQMLLAEIAKTDKSMNVRETAIEKLTDQVLLSEIAKSDNQLNRDALSKITDPNCFLDIAKHAIKVEIRERATDKLKDPAAIMEIVKAEPDWHAKFTALWQLKDEPHLAIIAKERLLTSIDVKRGKLELLPGETVRTEIRTGRKQQISVWRSLQDKKAIATITIKPGSVEYEGKIITDIPTLAVMILTDQSLLVDVAKNAFRSNVRLLAVEKLTDKAALIEIAKIDKDSNVRKAAQNRKKHLKKN